MVATYHTHFAAYLKYYRVGSLEPLVWRLMRDFYRRCAEVYVAAASMADELRARGVEANYVEAPFGVDLRQFSPARRSLDWRRSLGIADHEVVIAFVGRLVWRRGWASSRMRSTHFRRKGCVFKCLWLAMARPAKPCNSDYRVPFLPAIFPPMRWRPRMRLPISS